MGEALLTVKEAARDLRYSEFWVRKLCRDGVLKATRISKRGSWRIPIAEIERMKKVSQGDRA